MPERNVPEALGVYRNIEQIPTEYRLESYQNLFAEEDLWAVFTAERAALNGELSKERMRAYEYVGKEWKRHMEGYGCHHALVNPTQVEEFISGLLSERTVATVYETYFVQLLLFYEWLWYHPGYPHPYSPVLLAVLDGDACSECWQYRVDLR
jgi:hypothetical protein